MDEQDFESVTSTNSIIPADWLTNIIHDGGGIGKPFHAEILLGIVGLQYILDK